MTVFSQDLLDSTTPAFKILALNITTELNRGYRRIFPDIFLRCIVILFRPGAPFNVRAFRVERTEVETNLIFRNRTVVPNVTNTVDTLMQALNDSVVFLDILPSSINAVTVTTPTTATNTTATNTTTTTITTTTMSTTTTTTTSTTTTSSATATNRPQIVITFLFPLSLVVFFLLSDRKN
ncbi:hypothetical protein AAFF_G00392790 [Aldrovandia affinis]|uniref:Uncharacterized protein n=1 Tax=Aldrovandia affinis TaxID=143900 RepID=A0AAD7R663_9TELE|nr:hypothetical protein AAFF_G00392790 [Aldrovandia affinis]